LPHASFRDSSSKEMEAGHKGLRMARRLANGATSLSQAQRHAIKPGPAKLAHRA
jgi:hypothetical protein